MKRPIIIHYLVMYKTALMNTTDIPNESGEEIDLFFFRLKTSFLPHDTYLPIYISQLHYPI